jgi:hypothetical protein
METIIPQVLAEIQLGLGLGLAAAAKTIPGGRGLPNANASTLFRWCKSGSRAVDGRRVKLEHVRIGSRVVTSGPALERFIISLSEPVNTTSAPQSPAARQRASVTAERKLISMGC